MPAPSCRMPGAAAQALQLLAVRPGLGCAASRKLLFCPRLKLHSMPALLRSLRRHLFVPPSELQAALLLAWLALSASLGVLALAALAAPAETVLEAAARCAAPAGHREACALCGMTHAFLAMRKGDVSGAREASAASVILFPAFVLNETMMAFVFFRRMRRGWRPWRRHRAAAGNPEWHGPG